MKIKLTILLALACTTIACAKNLLENADFSKGSRGWEGDLKSVTLDDENKVAAVTANASTLRTISQRFEVHHALDLALKFKYKTGPDYTGKGFRVLFERPNSSYTYQDHQIKPNDNWQTFEWNFSDIKGVAALKLKIEVRQGAGTIYFDDFVLEPK